jgi:hypothetical protein
MPPMGMMVRFGLHALCMQYLTQNDAILRNFLQNQHVGAMFALRP